MVSEKSEQSLIEEMFFSIYRKILSGKDIQIPQYSHRILEYVFNKAFDQTVMVRQRLPTLSIEAVLLSTFMTEIESLRKDEKVIILISKRNACFISKKKSLFSIVVVQPKIPTAEQHEEKATQYGKILVTKPEAIRDLIKELMTIMAELKKTDIDFACFPELFFVDEKEFHDSFCNLAVEKDCFIVAGSFHDEKRESNISRIFLPDGTVVEQSKIFRAEKEGIKEKPIEFLEIIDFGYGGFCVLICIDGERDAIREVLKERLDLDDCPVLIFNPSDTEHPPRSINVLTNNLMILLSAAIVFCNTKQKGGSTILVPLVKLKNNDFKLFHIDSSDETQIEKAEVDLNLLITNRKTRQAEVVSMIK